MTPPLPPANRATPRRTGVLAALGIACLSVLLFWAVVAYLLTGYLRLSADMKNLRNTLTQTLTAGWQKEIELNIGSCTIGAAHAGLSFARLDPEARAALRAIHGAEVGVYRLAHGRPGADQAAMLMAADGAMAGRGWDRLVGVVNPHEFVAVYVPVQLRSPRDVTACVVVLEERQLVIVSARGNLEPLWKLALHEAGARPKAHLAARLR